VVLHDFIVEHREVQGKTQLDGVAWRQSDLVGLFVSLQSVLLNLLKEVSFRILSDVAVIVTDHLNEEGL
jgi:hypothetical protein